MKVSIITAVFNNMDHIESCVRSVLGQTYREIEYIVIDGGSTDGTVDVIKKYEDKISKWVSEPDKGIYDALNKGLKMATGDIVGFLHADDIYAGDGIIEKVVSQISEYNVDSCYGDLQYVDKDNPDKIVRYWKSSPYKRGSFKRGWMPPHPTFFARREIYEKFGGFNTAFKIAADYELMLRFIENHGISTRYIPAVLVKMRTGGISNRSAKNMIRKSMEDYEAWKVNNLGRGAMTIFLKNISKIPQFFRK